MVSLLTWVGEVPKRCQLGLNDSNPFRVCQIEKIFLEMLASISVIAIVASSVVVGSNPFCLKARSE